MTNYDTIRRRIDHAMTLTENVHEHLDDSAESGALLKAIGILEQASLEAEDLADGDGQEGPLKDE